MFLLRMLLSTGEHYSTEKLSLTGERALKNPDILLLFLSSVGLRDPDLRRAQSALRGEAVGEEGRYTAEEHEYLVHALVGSMRMLYKHFIKCNLSLTLFVAGRIG